MANFGHHGGWRTRLFSNVCVRRSWEDLGWLRAAAAPARIADIKRRCLLDPPIGPRYPLVKRPQDWRWSSYNNFAVDKTVVAGCPIQIDYVRLPEAYRA
jgi:hypothetical protein